MSMTLFQEYAVTHDIHIRNLLVKANHNLARKEAHTMAACCHEPYEDLEQEAVLGLIRSVENFNPNKGIAFSSYAVPYIHGKLLQYLRDKGHLIRLSQSTQSLINRSKKLTQKLGRNPTRQEIVEHLNCSVEKYEAAITAKSITQGLVAIEENENMIYFPATESNCELETPVIEIDWSNLLSQGELATLRKKKNRRRVWVYLANAATATTTQTR